MNRKKVYLVGFLLIVGILAYLLSTTLNTAFQYYVTAGEFITHQDKYRDKTLKIAGHAIGVTKTDSMSGIVYQFNVTEETAVVPVRYKGLAPDTFKEGSEVVVTGLWKDEGYFEASEILAKCASKYEAKVK
ncbi:cytochrome c maturation protein CcmE [bacterium]|nr:cytochrome c maturation protein CcmE [bacterium]